MFTTFLINLDKDTDRLEFMREQLFKLGIEYRRQPAILGKEYNPTPQEYDEELAIKKGGRAMLPGEIGCALSHAQVLEKIVSEKIPYTLVLEDDVLLPQNFKQTLVDAIEKNAGGNWEYLLFDYVSVGLPFIRQWISGAWYDIRKTWQKKPIKTVSHFFYTILKGIYIIPLSIFEGVREWYKRWFPGPVRFFRPVYFAGAYLVSLEGAKKLHSLINPVVYTADQLPNQARVLKGLHFRCYAPRAVSQLKREFGSSILDLDGSQL